MPPVGLDEDEEMSICQRLHMLTTEHVKSKNRSIFRQPRMGRTLIRYQRLVVLLAGARVSDSMIDEKKITRPRDVVTRMCMAWITEHCTSSKRIPEILKAQHIYQRREHGRLQVHEYVIPGTRSWRRQ